MFRFGNAVFQKGDKVRIKTFEKEEFIGEIVNAYDQTLVLETVDGDMKEIDDHLIDKIECLS